MGGHCLGVEVLMTGPSSIAPALLTTPQSAPPPGVVEEYRDAGGVRFRYLRGGIAEGTPVLFLHGWPTWAEVWLPVARIIGTRRPWIAIDLPCHNRSSNLPGADHSVPAYRRAVSAFVDAMGLARFAAVGNSLGGGLAISLAVDRPHQVERLAILDAAGLTAKFPSKTSRLYLPFILGSYFRAPPVGAVHRLLTRAVFFDQRFADENWIQAISAAWRPPGQRRAYRQTALALRRPEASVAKSLPRIDVPTLVISGKQDVQFPWQSAMDASRQIPNARFVSIEKAGHFPMVERPDETSQALVEFLAGP